MFYNLQFLKLYRHVLLFTFPKLLFANYAIEHFFFFLLWRSTDLDINQILYIFLDFLVRFIIHSDLRQVKKVTVTAVN